MAAGYYSFLIEQGATTEFELQYKDSNNVPIDLSGYSARMQIKSNYSDDNPVIYATLSSSILPDGTGLNLAGIDGLNPPSSGTIGVYISATTSSNFTFDTAKYDIELYNPVGEDIYTVRLLEGMVKLSKEVTR